MKKMELIFPWLLVCIATVASLVFSELYHKEPCTLCWYQRVMIFPLAIILGIAAFRNAYRIILYVLPLSLLGWAISLYHVLMIRYFSQKATCPTCTVQNGEIIPLTFPLLALGAFTLLNFLLFWIYFRHRNSKKL